MSDSPVRGVDDAHQARSLAAALAPGTLLAGVAGGMVFPIFPIVGHEVGLSAMFIGVILAANRAMRVVCAPLIGVISDRIGARRTLLTGLVIQIFVIALYIAGMLLHHEGAGFLVGRLLHGPGSACVFVAASALSLEAGGSTTPATVRASTVLGIPIGFVVGGLLSEAVGNVITFAIAGGAVIIALAAATITVPDIRTPMRKRPGFLEALGEMRDRRLLGIGGLNFALAFAATGMILSTLAYVVAQRHLSVFGLDARGTSGILMAILSLTDAATTTSLGRLGDRWHAHARIAAAALGVSALGLVSIGVTTGLAGTALGVAAVGLGAAGLGPSVLVLMGEIVPAGRRGTAAGLLQLSGDVGGMLGPLIGTALFANALLLPYVLTAGLLVAFVPVALWLARTTET